MSNDIEKYKSKRAHIRASITKLVTKIDNILSSNVEANDEISELNEHLINKEILLKEVNAQIEDIVDFKEFENDLDNIEKYDELVISTKFKIKKYLNKFRTENEAVFATNSSDASSASVQCSSNMVKLPKLNINKFSGDPSAWLEFYNSFITAIDSNTHLSRIEKFVYLKSYLVGQAHNVVKGFQLTSENYNTCLELLKEKFGKTDIIINAHMSNLLSMQPVKNSANLNALRNLYDVYEINIRSLGNLGISIDSYGQLLNPILLKLLPQDLVLDFHRKRDHKKDVSITELIEFLKNEISFREATLSIQNMSLQKSPDSDIRNFEHKKQNAKYQKYTASNVSTLNTSFVTPKKIFCIFCKSQDDHTSLKCKNVSNKLKRLQLKNENRCYLCLGRQHTQALCRSKNIKCNLCHSETHNELFCNNKDLENKNTSKERFLENSASKDQTTKTNLETSHLASNTSVMSMTHNDDSPINRTSTLLQTCVVSVENNKKKQLLRILCDSASERTFVLKKVAESLNLRPIGKEKLFIYCFGQKYPKEIEYDVVLIELKSIFNNKSIKVEALVTDIITNSVIKTASKDVIESLQQKGIKAFSDQDMPISLLLGGDIFWKIQGKSEQIKDDLFISHTIFGTTVQGRMTSSLSPLNVMAFCVTSKNMSLDLEQFWRIESLGIHEDEKTNNADVSLINTFESNLNIEDGRYTTNLLWKLDKSHLNNNFENAKFRFLCLKNKLMKDDALYESYNTIIKDQLQKGIIEKCEHLISSSYFMPYHAICRPDKSTTQIRIVYDASSKKGDFNSLNDCLLSGPNLNPNILDVILKFREHKISFCCDIEKAYLQISINAEDRDYLKFLYFQDCDRDKDFASYRFRRVCFGVRCSAFILAGVIKYHLKKYENNFEETCKMLNNYLYVDDLYFGADTVEKALQLSTEAAMILREANMNLRKFETNSKELREKWVECGISLNPQDAKIKPLKVLGINWDTIGDEFQIELSEVLNSIANTKDTKRCVLQTAAKCFDPTGFLSPFIIRIKCLLQLIWESGTDWDEIFNEGIKEKWRSWCSELHILKGFSVPRYFFVEGDKIDLNSIQLHIFSDSSLKAYGAVGYFRYCTESGDIKTTFIMAKSRVSPLKKLTLPRLELLGALIASRMGNYLQKLFNVENIFYWTDSMIVMHWIKGSASRWKQFVCNRVLEIQNLSDPVNWKHCEGKNNPADLVTRGCHAGDLMKDPIWLKGPSWLSKPEEYWPKLIPEDPEIDIENERKNIKETSVNVVSSQEQGFDILYKYSSWTKLERVVAWCLRFIKNSKTTNNRNFGFLSSEEIRSADNVICKLIQQFEFRDELTTLRANKQLNAGNKLISLNPFIDKDGLLRVGGRLKHAEISEDKKFPIILPKNHFVTDLIIKYYHGIYLHAGSQLLLSVLRQRFWIVNAKAAIKKVNGKCITCRKWRAELSTQIMADLPKSRVIPGRVFSKIGVDFTGSFSIKARKGRGVKTLKCYICLFVCFTTKAVHLEVVSDLSTPGFIAALRRFISRRGKPVEIHSDCGTNFIGANKELNKMLRQFMSEEKFQVHLATEGIKWKFNPPAAPHFGGLWEAGVKSLKYHLKRALGTQILTYEEFNTLTIQIESCLNSRPLTPVSNDPNDLDSLTPAHFLIGTSFSSLPEKDLSDEKITVHERWKLTQSLFHSIWKRWSSDYLSLLQQRPKWNQPKKDLKINDLVIIKDVNQPPLKWKLGRVIELFPGNDNRVRVVNVKTATGILKRPISKLCLLPVND